jgi:sodium-dependent phosphate cotransporter
MSMVRRIFRFISIIALLYLFLVSIKLMGSAFKLFGKDFAEQLISTTSNPFIGLFIGILATSLIQSSSTVTSMVVGFVAGGVLNVSHAIPIVMGANIGTSVTNVLVSLGYITRREEFGRAFAGALVHDIFNILAVIVMFPLELATGFLEKTAGYLANSFNAAYELKLMNPIKKIVEPVVHLMKYFFTQTLHFAPKLAGTALLSIALLMLFGALFLIVKIMRSVVASRAELIFNRFIGRYGLLTMFLGLIFTLIVQSSSVTTSIVVPIVGAGILTVEQIYPLTLGANLGTTITAILASLTGNVAGITIAFVHSLFNISGIILFYPVRIMRQIPITLAKKIAARAVASRAFALVYIVVVFFLIPGMFIFISKLFR